jgi:iron complex outermembrane receptor protein
MNKNLSLLTKICALNVCFLLSCNLFAQQLEEVLVTAERIEANLQEVPMAVTALSADQLDAYQIDSTMDLTKTVPGMVYRKNTGTASASNVYIRGFGDDESRLTDPTTGLYIDGVFVGRPYGSLMELVEAGSVEVLRGPQGTLYGRNTIAGAIKVTSRQRGEPGAKIAVSAGNEGYKKVKAYADFNLSDSAGMSIAGLMVESDGFVDAGEFGKQGGKDLTAFRLAYDQSFENGWELKLSYDTAQDDSDPVPATPRGTYATSAASTKEYIDVTDSDGATLALTGAVGDWDMSLLYGRRTIENYLDSHISCRFVQSMDQEQDSLELSGNRDFGIVNITTGLFWFDETFDYEQDFCAFSSWGADYDFKTEQTAAFINAKWILSDALTLTTGLRVMQEDKNLKATDANNLKIGSFPVYTCLFGGPACTGLMPFDDNNDKDNEDYRIAIDYKVNNNVMTYASFSTGSRSGGWSSDSLAKIDQEELETLELGIRTTFGNHRINLTAYDSELEGFQQGVTRGGGFSRENADGTEFQGIEVEVSGNLTDKLSYFAYITSTDAEYTSLDIVQAQSFLGSGAAAQLANCPAAGGVDQNPNIWKSCAYGLNVKGAPDMTWSAGLSYAMTESVSIELQGHGADETDNLTANPDYAKTDKYDMWDMSLTFSPPNSSWAIKLWGKNITDQSEVANATGGLVYMYDPRSYGATVSLRL